MNELQMDHPQISLEHRKVLDEEISPAEVEDAINEAHEISAPGPSGQTFTLYKLLFQELSGIFTAAVNHIVFNMELPSHKLF
jgi:hypothetical protein